METHNLTPKDSLELIQKQINMRKAQYEQNGFWFLFWGLLIMIAGFSQYYLISIEQYEISFYPWVILMTGGFVITFAAKFYVGYKAGTKSTNKKSKTSSGNFGLVWAMTGVMAMFSGFLFHDKFGVGLNTMIYAPFCVAALATGLYIRSTILIICSVIAAILSFVALTIAWQYHPLIAAVIGCVLLFIPGIKLFTDHKKRQSV